MTTALLAALAVPSASAVPPVCFGPAPDATLGPLTIESYGVNCTDVAVDDQWSVLPDEGEPEDWEGGVAACANQECRHIDWTCLGGDEPKRIEEEVDGATVVVHHCTPGPHPGPAP